MKSMILVALALVAVAVALPVEKPVAEILTSNFEQTAEGYNYGFTSNDGVVREEQGTLKEALDEENKPHVVVVVRGSYSYPREDGTVETINYSADENGFFAEGPSIPKNERR